MTEAGYFKPRLSHTEPSSEVATVAVRHSFASPESERHHRNNPLSFNAVPSIERLASDQGVPPTTKFDDLLGNLWPEDKSVEDFLEARRRWRREGRDSDA